MSFKRSRVSRSDSFDHPSYSRNSSTQNPNKFFKPSFAVSSPVKASVGVGMKLCQQSLGNFLKECFFCKSSIQSDKSIFMYRYSNLSIYIYIYIVCACVLCEFSYMWLDWLPTCLNHLFVCVQWRIQNLNSLNWMYAFSNINLTSVFVLVQFYVLAFPYLGYLYVFCVDFFFNIIRVDWIDQE